MTDATPTADERIEFIQYHQPPLKDGTYTLEIQQTITSTDLTKPIDQAPFTAQRTFVVAGERFTLTPTLINAAFPPDGSLGDHSNLLPHILLTRSTLPWERLSDERTETAPWVALLLFDETESPTMTVGTVGSLLAAATSEPRFPGVTLEIGQSPDAKVTVIDLPWRVLREVLPTLSELAMLAHVRQRVSADGTLVGDELAVIIGNRLPASGKRSTVHLVSLEERFVAGEFDTQGAQDDDLIRLVSLFHWSFACADPSQSFKGLLETLDRNPGTLRLPASGNAIIEGYLSQGRVAVTHRFRQGDHSVSWYHGPLAPLASAATVAVPTRTADALLRYDRAIGMFDTGYAAAWELGRLLVLQDKHCSVALYAWKRQHAQYHKQAALQDNAGHLPIQSPDPITAIPSAVATWFQQLSYFVGVPFNYLVPDERMVPPESIRFFSVDQAWVQALLDGAFSIGRLTAADCEYDQHHDPNPATPPYAQASGFLLRSAVVAGWPGLLVDATDQEGRALGLLRMERLSANVLLCLFEGQIHQAALHLKPETLHFGLDEPDADHPVLYKTLRTTDGKESPELLEPLPWRDEERRVLDIAALRDALQTMLQHTPITAAEFALQMIEGVEQVAFTRDTA